MFDCFCPPLPTAGEFFCQKRSCRSRSVWDYLISYFYVAFLFQLHFFHNRFIDITFIGISNIDNFHLSAWLKAYAIGT